jgi:tetratricopeptide (TPR) repeat protein
VANETAGLENEQLQKVLGRARRLADAHEYEAVLELLDEFMPEPSAAEGGEVAQTRAQMLVLRGRAREVLGQWGGADEDVRAVLGLATRLEDRTALVAALLIMGELQKNRGDLQDAQDTYMNAARVAEAIEDKLGGAEANLALASIFSKMGDPQQGEQRLASVFSAVRGLEALPRACRVLCAATVHKAVEEFRRGSQEETVNLCREALKLMEDDPLALEAAEAHRFLGVVASMRLQHKEALEHHLRALDIYKKFGYRFGQAKIYNSIGQTLLQMSRSDEALHFMEKAEGICSELGALGEAATLYGKLGQAYLQKEDFDKAIQYFQKDLQLTRKLGGKRALAYIQRNLGQSLGQAGDVSQAVAHFKESLQLFQQVGDELNTGKLYMDLCYVYVRQKNYERAKGMAQWAVNIFSKLKQSFEIAYMNTLLGMIKRGEKNFVESEKHFKDASEFFKFRDPTNRLVETLYEYGLLLVDMGKKDRAMERLVEALTTARSLGLKEQANRCFAALEQLDEIYLIRTVIDTF